MKKHIATIILIFGILIVAIGMMISMKMTGKGSSKEAIVTMNGDEVARLNLSVDDTSVFASPDGSYNIVVIKDGKVSVTESNCENQTCVKQGEISEVHELIVCLPHGLVIEIGDMQ